MSSLERETTFDPEQKIWSGRKVNSLFPEDATIGEIALKVLKLNPQKVIQICDSTGERITCGQLSQLGIKMAHYFKLQLGLHQEDVIGIMANNTTYLAPVILGAFLIGAPISTVHYAFDKNSVKYIFSLTKPKVVFCDQEAYAALSQALDDIGLNCKIYTVKGEVDGVANVQDLLREIEAEDNFVPAVSEKGGNQTAIIICSSGTTGFSKGVCISHRNLLSTSCFLFIKPDDILFTLSTLYWISGLLVVLQSFITGATRVITDQPFSPELTFELIETYKITQILGPTSHAALTIQCPDIEQRDLSSVRSYICGGSPVSSSLSSKIKEYLPKHSFCVAYGFSEIGGITNLNRWPEEKEGSVGRLNPNMKAKIISEDGKPLGIGETGEIYLWSPYKWSGYYGNPDMTQLIMDSDGWMRSGDMGYFDEEGFLFVCGRKKEILKYKNFQISPIEIEEIIAELSGVVEVCIFGIPDVVAADLPAAAIVKSPECDLTEKDVFQRVANSRCEFKHLHGGVYFVPELPKTPSGKVQRQNLLQIVEEMRKRD